MRIMNPVRFFAFTALLLALAALTTVPARAEVGVTASGNIVEHSITAATIDPISSIATISGTIQCSTPTLLMVQPSVRQFHGLSERSAQYFGGDYVACDTTPTQYRVTATPGYESARLVPGPASINSWAWYCADGQCYGYGTDADLRLMPAR